MKAVLLILLLILAYLFPQNDSRRASLKPVAVNETAAQHRLVHSETADRADIDIKKTERAEVKNF